MGLVVPSLLQASVGERGGTVRQGWFLLRLLCLIRWVRRHFVQYNDWRGQANQSKLLVYIVRSVGFSSFVLGWCLSIEYMGVSFLVSMRVQDEG